ncbi:rod shape-determining protein RodA [Magnetospirillum moscoviense]|uniref:Peptidoglycan glycosyltransferase MrdB n=1 Tax=Magnetospirillum moscoviense TaxID=1437059 RepID=A0A178MTE0_9PROT|nr:rod shape-determining protein RodA [Magnetospirillum moscoviense]MBF0324133.1 rod shape-determining protein RodA [Alphaproteobacteria bacterium]OAN52944.1 rod shape-determining protein RodA [Magnetospirillum moscoviense]
MMRPAPRLSLQLNRAELSWREKLWHINWTLISLLTTISSVGFLTLYSAAGGSLEPWAVKQMIRFAMGIGLMVGVAVIDIRVWIRHAYVFYAVSLVLLVAVEIKGTIGMGAQRWIDLGFIQLQPSELTKIALILTLARYFHGAAMQDIGRPTFLIIPLLLVFAPIALVLKQPDLGTAMMLLMSSGAIFFMAGVRMWKFGLVLAGGLGSIPVAWQFLREYQKKRVIIFMNPEQDPLGAGYHITQSKIALGSGGVFGKGYMSGTQSKLNFLPEKQTDFIFTMFAEEWGLIGGLVLLFLYGLLIAYGYAIALRCRSQFGRLVALGITTTFFLYVFINTAMVMGLVPVVGVPLPMISYGGTAMLSLLFGWGLVMSAYIHRDTPIGRRGALDD